MQGLNNPKIISVKNIAPYKQDIIKLWQEAFGDSRAYASCFLDKYNELGGENLILGGVLEGDELVSFCFLLPCSLASKGEERNGYYLYALATKVSKRGKGYGSALCKYLSEEHLDGSNRDFLFLVPAERELFSFYKKLGYAPFGKVYAGKINNNNFEGEASSFELREISKSQFADLRGRTFKESQGIAWGESHLSYAYEENAFLGGKSYAILDESKGEIAVCLLGASNDRAVLRELYFSSKIEPTEEQAKEIFSLFKYKSISFRSNKPILSAEERTLGMIFQKSNRESQLPHGYIGLFLD